MKLSNVISKSLCLVGQLMATCFQGPGFPGGHLIGVVLLINLIAAHANGFNWGWSKSWGFISLMPG